MIPMRALSLVLSLGFCGCKPKVSLPPGGVQVTADDKGFTPSSVSFRKRALRLLDAIDARVEKIVVRPESFPRDPKRSWARRARVFGWPYTDLHNPRGVRGCPRGGSPPAKACLLGEPTSVGNDCSRCRP